jgi:hypothetical protein
MMIIADPLPDTDLDQIEQRILRALGAAPPPWSPELETRGPIGGYSFIRVCDQARLPTGKSGNVH